MSIRSILAVYSGEADQKATLDLGIGMVGKYGAHLTGIAWHGLNTIQSQWRGRVPADVAEMLDERDAEAVAAIRASFEEAVAAAGITGQSRFLEVEGDSDFSLAETARGFDIVVMGRHSNEAGRAHFSGRPDVVALRSGRPVIVTPPNHHPGRMVENALVAWDGKRASTRAISDALRILEGKSVVTLLSVGKAPQERPGATIVEWLGRHGIEAAPMLRPASRQGVGQTILEVARETGAGLIVMGAYEHSKFTEDLLGGVTSELIRNAHVPVLMSH
jgi:nucleotide-binding universal stress UspA family protein